MFVLPCEILSIEATVVVPFFEKIAKTRRNRIFTEVLCSLYVCMWFLLVLKISIFEELCVFFLSFF